MAKGKQRLPVIDSVVYSNLIFEIAKGNNYAQKIFESFKKKKPVSVIARQLDILEKKEKFITSETKEDKSVFPMQRLRIYSVNWEKINREFFKFILAKSKTQGFKIPEKYATNKFLSLYFKKIFSANKEIGVEKINEIFESFSISLFEHDFDFYKQGDKKELKEFIEFLELINPAQWENDKFVKKSMKIIEGFEHENGIEATKPIENSPEKFRDTSQIKPSAKRKGDNENEK